LRKYDYYVNRIKDAKLRELTRSYLEGLEPEFSRVPASTRFHHCEVGGLVRHTLEVCFMAVYLAEMYPQLDMDYVICAALIHDGGKACGPTEGHERRVVDALSGLPVEVRDAVLGHMGGWSKTGVYPDTLLGAVIHAADLISSRS